MSIILKLPSRYSSFIRGTKGALALDVEGGTVGECLDDAFGQYPALREKFFFSETGRTLRPTVQLSLNERALPTDCLAEKVRDGDVIEMELYVS